MMLQIAADTRSEDLGRVQEYWRRALRRFSSEYDSTTEEDTVVNKHSNDDLGEHSRQWIGRIGRVGRICPATPNRPSRLSRRRSAPDVDYNLPLTTPR